MKPTDPNRRVSAAEVAALRDISLWRARRWLRSHGAARRDGKGYSISLGELLRLCPDAVAPDTQLSKRLDMASEWRAVLRELESVRARLRALESSNRKRHAQRRRRAREMAVAAKPASAHSDNETSAPADTSN